MQKILTTIQDSTFSFLLGVLQPASPYKGAMYALITVIVLWLLYKITTKALRKYMQAQAHKAENIQHFLLLWRYAWFTVGLIFLIISFSGSIATLGISAAFLGMILGWSLQAPVTGIAAWLMIILKRPFKIGDRIIISGITGDVVDITLTHILLNQVGGTISGEEKSGRSVLIPNAILFQQVIHNYTFSTRFLLDEITLMVTFASDVDEAKKILIAEATQTTKDIIEKTSFKPFVHAEFADSGIRLRLRYKTYAKERQKTSSNMTLAVIKKFNATSKVEFAYPHSEVIYRSKPPVQ